MFSLGEKTKQLSDFWATRFPNAWAVLCSLLQKYSNFDDYSNFNDEGQNPPLPQEELSLWAQAALTQLPWCWDTAGAFGTCDTHRSDVLRVWSGRSEAPAALCKNTDLTSTVPVKQVPTVWVLSLSLAGLTFWDVHLKERMKQVGVGRPCKDQNSLKQQRKILRICLYPFPFFFLLAHY